MTTTLKKAQSKTKNKAPNWVSYFGRAKKKIRVIYQIEFYARNKSRTCYASLKKIAEACACSIDTVYDAITLALSIGILEKEKYSTIFRLHPVTLKPLWNSHVLLTWVGDVEKTAGETCFGEASRFFASENPVVHPAKNPAYIEHNESSLKKKEEVLSPSLKKTKEELKDYLETQVNTFWSSLKERYKGKEHFLSVDLEKHLERFKRDNPLKKCSGCGEINRDGGSWCNECHSHWQRKEAEKLLERNRASGLVELPKMLKDSSPAKVQEIAQLERLLKSYLEGSDLVESEYHSGKLTKEVYDRRN